MAFRTAVDRFTQLSQKTAPQNVPGKKRDLGIDISIIGPSGQSGLQVELVRNVTARQLLQRALIDKRLSGRDLRVTRGVPCAASQSHSRVARVRLR
jgi:hypothetical protein